MKLGERKCGQCKHIFSLKDFTNEKYSSVKDVPPNHILYTRNYQFFKCPKCGILNKRR